MTLKKTMIAIPCLDMVHTGFCHSLVDLVKPEGCETVFAQSSLVYDSRNTLAEIAIKKGVDRVLWLDSDMNFKADLLMKLSAHLDNGLDFVSGIYSTRKAPYKLVVYEEVEPEGAISLKKVPHGLKEIKGCGFGGVLMTVDLLKEVKDNFGNPFTPVVGFGEDLSFCYRVTMLGKKMWCDGSVRMGHIGQKIYEV